MQRIETERAHPDRPVRSEVAARRAAQAAALVASLAALVLAAAGCATGLREAKDLGLKEPEFYFLDLYYKAEGPGAVNPIVTIAVVVGVQNPNDVPVTVEKIRVDVRGAPELRHERREHPVDLTLAAGQKSQFRVDLFSTLVGVTSRTYVMPPLTLTGRAYLSQGDERFQANFARSMAASQRDFPESGEESEDEE
jgi:hypothetical protein